MDPGLRTSERSLPPPPAQHRRATILTPPAPLRAEQLVNPSVTCRNCRAQLLLEDMDGHECDPRAVKAAAATASPRGAAATSSAVMLDAAASFLDSFLDPGQKPSEQPPPPPPPMPPTSKTTASTSPSPSSAIRPPEPLGRYESLPYRPTVDRSPLTSPTHVATSANENHNNRPSASAMAETTATSSPSGGGGVGGPAADTSWRLGGRSLSVTSPPVTDPTAASLLQHRPRSASNYETSSAPSITTTTSTSTPAIQCRLRGVRVTKDRVAVYAIASRWWQPAQPAGEVLVERRYREFHAFARAVCAMFPEAAPELWRRLPPKTYCLGARGDGFLLRRKNGLEDFLRGALELLDLGTGDASAMAATTAARGTIGQWYLVRQFLRLPPTPTTAPTSVPPLPPTTVDRSLVAAMHELKKLAIQKSGWVPVGWGDEHDATFERTSDGFAMLKRVKSCPFPARAVFDMITRRQGTAIAATAATAASSSTPTDATTTTTLPAIDAGASGGSGLERLSPWRDPCVESTEILRRENRQSWTERTIYKGRWGVRNMEMISLKSWKVEESGSIVLAAIPADESEWPTGNTASSGTTNAPPATRVDCVLGGWILTPVAGEETCTVTWLLQANFGTCDPEAEFTGSEGLTRFLARQFLVAWADEIVHLLAALETTYEPEYYRNLGPLLSGGEFQKLKLDRRDTACANGLEDPRVYVLALELEPTMCLLIHKNTNTNVLIFRTMGRGKGELELQTPLRAEWIMFEKAGNPRQDLSPIERTTTYSFTTRNIGQNVFHFTLDLLRRDCLLRYDAVHGFGLFTTINGKPNILLKRVYLSYGKSSRLSFAKIDEITLFGDTELEVIRVNSTK